MANGFGAAFGGPPRGDAWVEKRQRIAQNQADKERERAAQANEMDAWDWFNTVIMPVALGVVGGVAGGLPAAAAAPALAGAGAAAAPAAAGAAAAGTAAATGGGIAAGLKGAATGLGAGGGLGSMITALRRKDAELGLSGLRTAARGAADLTEERGAIGRWL